MRDLKSEFFLSSLDSDQCLGLQILPAVELVVSISGCLAAMSELLYCQQHHSSRGQLATLFSLGHNSADLHKPTLCNAPGICRR